MGQVMGALTGSEAFRHVSTSTNEREQENESEQEETW